MKDAWYIAVGVAVAGLGLAAATARAQPRWETLPVRLPEPRAEAAAVALGGQVYVVGGRDARGRVVDRVDRFDPGALAWGDPLPSLRRARTNAAAVVLDGRVYVIGGRGNGGQVLEGVEVYDPSDGRWRDAGDLEEEREGHAAVVVGGRIYVLGGSDEDGDFLASVEVYDPAEGEWRVAEGWRLGSGRAAFGAVALGDSVYAFGGYNRTGPLPEGELLRRLLGSLPVLPPATFLRRGQHAVLAYGDSLFIIGGRGLVAGRERVLDDVTLYLPVPDLWLRAEPLRSARESFAAARAGSRLFVFGGRDAFGDVLPTIEVLDLAGMPTPTEPDAPLPDAFGLAPNHPNPFAGETTISFTVAPAVGNPVVLELFDLFGRRVATLVDAVLPPGAHTVVWDGTMDGRPAASGVYLCRLRQGARQATRPLTLVR